MSDFAVNGYCVHSLLYIILLAPYGSSSFELIESNSQSPDCGGDLELAYLVIGLHVTKTGKLITLSLF